MDVQELPVVGEDTEIHWNVQDAPNTQNCVCEAERVRRRERVIRWPFATEDLNFFRIGPKDAIERIFVSNWVPEFGTALVHAQYKPTARIGVALGHSCFTCFTSGEKAHTAPEVFRTLIHLVWSRLWQDNIHAILLPHQSHRKDDLERIQVRIELEYLLDNRTCLHDGAAVVLLEQTRTLVQDGRQFCHWFDLGVSNLVYHLCDLVDGKKFEQN